MHSALMEKDLNSCFPRLYTLIKSVGIFHISTWYSAPNCSRTILVGRGYQVTTPRQKGFAQKTYAICTIAMERLLGGMSCVSEGLLATVRLHVPGFSICIDALLMYLPCRYIGAENYIHQHHHINGSHDERGRQERVKFRVPASLTPQYLDFHRTGILQYDSWYS
ncbi:hypothetical protein BGX38DRAFT_250139 [Terfezia claveryi]|nr:hypothetical protein BGX38DRAFT_250139 [Terfezia claveryi]